MREIKFRAWHKTDRRLYPVTMLFMVDADILMLRSGDTHFSCSFDAVDLMQFTGIQDKQGKDIFEGDIVQCSDYRGDIVWDAINDGWRIRYANSYNLRNNEMMVIGNIYEHPELLKEG